MPKKAKEDRYSFYDVSKVHKKNVIRTLNNLSHKNYITKENVLNSNEVDCYRFISSDTESIHLKNSTIYRKKTVAAIEVLDYNIVIAELENLALNVSAKKLHKLKEFIDNYTIYEAPNNLEASKTTSLFHPHLKERYISLIANFLDTSRKYAQRVFNQLHSRIIFRYFQELYTNPTAVLVQGNKVKPIILDEFYELQVVTNFIFKNRWLFDEAILDELKKRKKKYIQDEQEREQYLVAVRDLDVANLFLHFDLVLDTQDRVYRDAIQVLMRAADNYLENEGYYNYIYVNYEYEFSNDVEEWYDDKLQKEQGNFGMDAQELALEYVKNYNEKNKDKYNYIYKVVSGDDDVSYEDDGYSDIVDSEEYHDESTKEETRQGSLSFDRQWENTYRLLYEGLKSDDPSINRYFQVLNYAKKLQDEYENLLFSDSNFFSKTGKVCRNKFYRTFDKEMYEKIKLETKETDEQVLHKVKFKLMKIKRTRWEYLYTMQQDPFIKSLQDFDIESLEFIPMDDFLF